MKNRVIEEIKSTGYYGIFHFGNIHYFNDYKYATKSNLYKYRMSKINVFTDENKSIIGIQAFYKNEKNEEIPGEEGRDQSTLSTNINSLVIPPYDYLCNLKVFVGSDCITKLIFRTKKGKELIVGNDNGQERKVGGISDDIHNIILCISGGYRETLDLISCKYISTNKYLGSILGFFELKKKIKNDNNFKQNILEKYNQLKDVDKFIFKTCCLADNTFIGIIKYCMFF